MKWRQLIVWGIALIAAVHFALFGYFLFRTAIFSPISDMFAYVDDYLGFRAGDVSLFGYLWQPHGEHHLVWIRVLTWVDVALFHTLGIPFMAAATAAIVATAVLVWLQVVRAQPRLGAATNLGLLAPMVILSTANATDCSVPINATYPFTVFFVVLAVVLFSDADGIDSSAYYRRLAAVVAAIGASMGTAAGLLTWPILLWIGWRQRLDRGWLLALAGFGVGYILFYARDLNFLGLAPALSKDTASFFSAVHLYKMLDYYFAFLGLPITRDDALRPVGVEIGAVLFFISTSAVALASVSNRMTSRLDRIAIGMILLGLGSAALAAVGRSDLVDGVKVPVRYALFVAALHVGLLCIVLPRVIRPFELPRVTTLKCAAGLGFAGLLLCLQIFIGRSAVQIARPIARDADCFAEQTQAGPVSPIVTRWPEDARRVIAALRREGLLAPRSRDCSAPSHG